FNSLHYLITTLQLPSSTLFPYTTLFRSITGSMCNNFFGEGYFSSHGVLKAKGLGMTRKFCSDAALNTLDGDIAELLDRGAEIIRSEEHTSELQSRFDLVCRLLLETKYKQ